MALSVWRGSRLAPAAPDVTLTRIRSRRLSRIRLLANTLTREYAYSRIRLQAGCGDHRTARRDRRRCVVAPVVTGLAAAAVQALSRARPVGVVNACQVSFWPRRSGSM